MVIDTGLPNQPRVQEQLRAADDGAVTHVVLTHAHADHYGAVDEFVDDETEVIAHPEFVHNQRYLKALSPLLMKRNAIFFPENTPALADYLGGAVKLLYPLAARTAHPLHRRPLRPHLSHVAQPHHAAVFEGMNEGKDVYTLMREIQLPPELAVPEVHGNPRRRCIQRWWPWPAGPRPWPRGPGPTWRLAGRWRPSTW